MATTSHTMWQKFVQFLLPKLGWLGDANSWGACIQAEGQVEEFIHSGNVTVLIMTTPNGLRPSILEEGFKGSPKPLKRALRKA